MDDPAQPDDTRHVGDASAYRGESNRIPITRSSFGSSTNPYHQSGSDNTPPNGVVLPHVSTSVSPRTEFASREHSKRPPSENGQNVRDYLSTFETLLQHLKDPMDAAEHLLRSSLSSQSADTNELLLRVHRFGGKRLRPILTMLSASAAAAKFRVGSPLPEDCIRSAVIVELVHTATLVHDDIIDGAVTRRHQPSMHVVSSTQNAILLGDWIFTQAYALASSGNSTVPGQVVAAAAKAVCEGEIEQDATIGKFELSENDCLEALKAKTGQLCGAACQLGGWSVGASEKDCDRLRVFGEQLGIAFQLQDDWLDYWGDETKAGKTLLTDLETQKPTIPMLRAITQLNNSDRDHLFQLLSDRPTNWKRRVLDLMEQTDASTYTRQMAEQIVSRAKSEIAGLPGKTAVEMLCKIADVAISRGT